MTEFYLLPHRSDVRLAELIATQIVSRLPEISSILDIGCGDGIVGKNLPSNIIYKGLDLSNASIYRKEDKDNRISYINPLDLKEQLEHIQEVDATLILDVIEHTQDFLMLFREALRLSKKYIVVSLPNELFIRDRIKFVLGKEHPAHSLDLVGQPEGFKHQYIINLNKARHILETEGAKQGFVLEGEWRQPLIPKRRVLQPIMWLMQKITSSQIWSTGSIYVFQRLD